MQLYCVMMARYNIWANEALLAAVDDLSVDQLTQDLGAPFNSILGTFNHLYVGDSIWMGRFQRQSTTWALDDQPYDTLADFTPARRQLDVEIFAHMTELDARHLDLPFRYQNMSGKTFTQPLSDVLMHFFNHQTHHRGQISSMITRLTGKAPVLDLIVCQRELT